MFNCRPIIKSFNYLLLKALDCGTPVITSDVQTDFLPGAGTMYGDRIEFVCREGYKKNGKYWGTYECRETGLWTLTETSYTGEIYCNCKHQNLLCTKFKTALWSWPFLNYICLFKKKKRAIYENKGNHQKMQKTKCTEFFFT